MSRTQDFLYEIARKNYEKEEQGGAETMRSLPFFGTYLAALSAAVAVMATQVQRLPAEKAAVAAWLLGAVLLLAIIVVFCISMAILSTGRPRVVATEREILRLAERISALVIRDKPGGTPSEWEEATLFDLRDSLIRSMSEVTAINRRENVARILWLKAATGFLAASLIMAFITMFGILVGANLGASHAANDPAGGVGASTGLSVRQPAPH